MLRVSARPHDERSGPSLRGSIDRRSRTQRSTLFDEHGLGQEPNNLAAIASLTGYRSLRWGRNLDLLITDQRSYRSEDPATNAAAGSVRDDFPEFVPQEALEILDAGRTCTAARLREDSLWGRGRPDFPIGGPPQTFLVPNRNMVPRSAPHFESDLENLGQARRPRSTCASIRRTFLADLTQALAGRGLRWLRWRRLEHRVCRARRDLRFRA